ncbi:MAG TPA: response regulator [Bacteroides sp.]|nr:response regulator [Bacteroides sp.]
METRKELIEEPGILLALFEHSPAAQLVIDGDALILMVNRKLESITGYSSGELEGKRRWYEMVPPAEKEICLNFVQRLRAGDENSPEKHECNFLQRNGNLKTVYLSGFPVLESGYMILSLIDISGQKEYEQMLKTARDKAEASEKLKTAFLGNLSHEIRTPMNAIAGFASLLRNQVLSEEKKNLYLAQIVGGSSDLLQLIEKTVILSRIDLGQVKISPRQFHVNKRLEELFERYRQILDDTGKKHIDLVLEPGRKEDDFVIQADPMRVTEVLNNLLENAVKFSRQGNITLGYTYNEENKSGRDMLLFYVKDTGPGISRDKSRIIFDRFVKLVDSNESLLRGAGLGLAICHDLVRLMGGEIWVETTEGRGSNFYFTLPVVMPKPSQSGNLGTRQEKKYEDWSAHEILVAEDIESNYLYIKELLSPTKMKILRARDGWEAVELFEKNPGIDMVLMDILMPGLDGYEATKKIRSLREKIPVIAQTAFTFEGEMINGLYAGCFTDYIMKPFTRDMLLAHIKKHLAGTI